MTTKTHKTFRTLAAGVRGGNEYWIERAKIEFVEGLAREMEKRSITRGQLAERIGASAAYVTKVLRGETNFTIETMVKLARAVSDALVVQVTIAQGNAPRSTTHSAVPRELRHGGRV